MRRSRRPVAAVLALALVAALGIGATLAWLTDETDEVANVFTVGKVAIDLYEHDYDPESGELDEGVEVAYEDDYKMVPGTVLPKDPTVVVKAGSEDCWVFVKVDETSNLARFISYSVDGGWTELEAVEGEGGSYAVYYREQAATSADVGYPVLAGNEVEVLPGVTKQMLDGLTEDTKPILAFTAYACQREGFGTAGAAWAEVGE